MYQYTLMPYKISRCNWLHPSRQEKFNCVLSKAQWLKQLQGYDYLLISRPDAVFWQGSGSLFPLHGFDHSQPSFWQIIKKPMLHVKQIF